MAKLNDAIRHHIVTGLACFQTPSEVARDVGEEFGIEITRQQVHEYNPLGRNGGRLAPKWHALFEGTRATFLDKMQRIPVANKAVRLDRIQRMFETAERTGNLQLAAQLLEQAAKEMGGMFTNRRELTGKDGGALKADITLADRIHRARERAQHNPAPPT